MPRDNPLLLPDDPDLRKLLERSKELLARSNLSPQQENELVARSESLRRRSDQIKKRATADENWDRSN